MLSFSSAGALAKDAGSVVVVVVVAAEAPTAESGCVPGDRRRPPPGVRGVPGAEPDRRSSSESIDAARSRASRAASCARSRASSSSSSAPLEWASLDARADAGSEGRGFAVGFVVVVVVVVVDDVGGGIVDDVAGTRTGASRSSSFSLEELSSADEPDEAESEDGSTTT